MEPSTRPIAPKPYEVFGPIPMEVPPSRLADLSRVIDELTQLGQPQSPQSPESTGLRRLDVLAQAYASILRELGCDLTSAHFKDTPTRAAKALLEMTVSPDTRMTAFPMEPSSSGSGMLYQNGISISSLCPHHILPWFGTVCIAYLPTTKILGLSKFSRLVRFAASGLRTQEEVTALIADLLVCNYELKPHGVGVSVRAYHTCMAIRGVRDSGVATTTQFLTGPFKDDPSTRAEFIGLVNHPPIMA